MLCYVIVFKLFATENDEVYFKSLSFILVSKVHYAMHFRVDLVNELPKYFAALLCLFSATDVLYIHTLS